MLTNVIVVVMMDLLKMLWDFVSVGTPSMWGIIIKCTVVE